MLQYHRLPYLRKYVSPPLPSFFFFLSFSSFPPNNRHTESSSGGTEIAGQHQTTTKSSHFEREISAQQQRLNIYVL
ncbi:hypothetical protein COCC4DRAFT_33328 [Bipolaris maydis ATCC 48331]|uniref:Uncharacterized protein n=2 Tax=Cochliobolus heterostrophus TaxID=5016 RepID=N4WR04_COCH4|nr:uncharacterized protein COCC4DRAFT_33328 [Bipolaris maydis ATCC 48331]ENI02924.1 hypothetical protein COCC4DRAFT_33328 [Bipolaris maydis ATCC 48331]